MIVLTSTESVVSVQDISTYVTNTNLEGTNTSSNTQTNYISHVERDSVVVEGSDSNTVTITGGLMGPPGVSSEDSMVYSKRIDFITDNLLYRGEALPGSLTSSPVWRIRRIEISTIDNDITESWADGNAEFDNVWDDRATKVYQ